MMPLLMMQLPDYHDVIDHPMDFGTVRRKLARNVYRSFEQFEVRLLVFVVCSSTMRNIDSVLLFVGFLDSVVGDE
jgi:bromodomain-containing protein 9